MRDLLKDPSRRGDIIEWISEKEGVFRVVNSAEVARLWGEKKKNKKEMTYEKMSRSLRYSRLEGYFSDLPKDKNYPKKLCFKFGPKSKDWY
ncbi:ets-related transcription factor elf-5 [Plakobranchus ocellatus]|uniref:Ets-related transcription factor elf-5 n=1 Tax=Plakobranchus ocellatus TaxID=259542 RepID=A0AAV3YNE1_9GAST|nr:ets-related transcription factor elf-5 [Plakobranchus ocellatus]